MAVDQAILDDIAGKIAGGLRMLGGFRQEAESQVRAVVEGALAHFDVVTNERMQVQEALLARAREEMTSLESRIKALEARLKDLESGG
ncbi:MAG TPA: accessory factor UbiK family protein [Mariprofundaceae bacterium]|nr:accessory factor UbiK family protein [Mariprofundaceae bacterium]